MTETFKKNTGVPNLKLLIYNSYLSSPFSFTLIFVTGEYKRLINYFTEEQIFEGTYFGALVYLFFFCFFCVLLILFTVMLSNSKDIIITGLSFFWLKGTKFSFFIIGGMLISTVGAVLIAVKSMLDNTRKKKEMQEKEVKIDVNNNK